MSEEFGGALPSVILAEKARLPDGLLEDVVAMRNYSRVKADYDAASAEDMKRMPKTYLLRLVQRIEHDLALEDIEASGE